VKDSSGFLSLLRLNLVIDLLLTEKSHSLVSSPGYTKGGQRYPQEGLVVPGTITSVLFTQPEVFPEKKFPGEKISEIFFPGERIFPNQKTNKQTKKVLK